VMTEMGKAMMGTGEAEGPNRAIAAAEAAISNPLLDDVSMKGARGVLINITGGLDMTLFEVDEAANRIRSEVDPEANIIFGSTFDQSLEGKVRISVVATGIEGIAAQQPRPVSLSLVASAGRPVAAPAERTEPMLTAAAQPASGIELRRETAGATALAAAPMAAPAVMPAPPPPAPAEAPRGTLTQPVMTQPALQPARAGAAKPFIAPPPVERMPPAPPPATPQAMAPQPAPAAPPTRRIPNLFSRVTGSAWARNSASGNNAPGTREAVTPQMRATPAQRPAPTLSPPLAAPQVSAPPAPAATHPTAQPAAGVAQPAQPRLSGLDPKDRLAASRVEEDLLDIPAFLRRQAN